MGFFEKIVGFIYKSRIKSTEVKTNNPYIGLMLKANEDDLIADELFRLGLCYINGSYMLGHDIDKAVQYFRLASEKGHPAAKVNLVMRLMKRPDDVTDEIIELLKSAADQGERQACYNYAISIHRGDVPQRDKIIDSLKYFRKSAEFGYAPAYSRLAYIYHVGEGVESNDAIAKYWAWLDFANIPEEQLGSCILHTLIEPSDLMEGNIVNFKKIIEDAARAGERDALCNWGTGLLSTDKAKAIEILSMSADKGHPIAQCNLARQYWTPEEKEYDKAFQLFLNSANNGCAEAEYGLAVMFGEGLGRDKDIYQAWGWLEKSVNAGCKEARKYFAHLIISNQLQEILPDKIMRGPAYLELSGV